jgi:hypothetical protein
MAFQWTEKKKKEKECKEESPFDFSIDPPRLSQLWVK